MARVAFFAVAAAMLGAASALEVVSPAEGSTVVADRWAGFGLALVLVLVRFGLVWWWCSSPDAACEGCPDTNKYFMRHATIIMLFPI